MEKLTPDSAVSMLNNMLAALDQLTVTGRQNCLIITGISQDIMRIRAYIAATEKGGKNNESN